MGAQARNGVGNALDVAGGFLVSGPENARLKREVAMARSRAVQMQAVQDENRRLKAQLNLAPGDPTPVANGWLIASSASSTRRYATVSAGSARGVTAGMPVRTAQGLVGRVLEVGHNAARVLLVTDTESTVPVRRATDGTPAFINGRGDGTLQVRLLSLGLNPLKTGDVFVTSGAGGLYWPGTPMAMVVSLTHDGAIARPLSDPAASEIVAVQPSWEPTADPTLPPPAPDVPPPPPKKPRAPKSPSPAKNPPPSTHERPAPDPPGGKARGAPLHHALAAGRLSDPVGGGGAGVLGAFVAGDRLGAADAAVRLPDAAGLAPIAARAAAGLGGHLAGPVRRYGQRPAHGQRHHLVVDHHAGARRDRGAFPWRNFLTEWIVAALMIVLYILAGVGIANAAGGNTPPLVVVPQMVLSVLVYPLAGRLVATLDRWRLRRYRVVG
jgi:rod shape-determining protein MreC